MIELKITGKIKGKVFKNLIEYACDNNDVMTFKVFTNNINKKENETRINEVLRTLKKTEQEIIELYNDKNFLHEVYEKLKTEEEKNWEIEFKKMCEHVVQIGEDLKEFEQEEERIKDGFIRQNIENIILNGMGSIMFQKNLKIVKEKLEKDFLKVEHKGHKDGMITDRYYYRISEKIKEILLEQNDLYSMKFPNCFEDISFFKDNSCWLETVSHEEMCTIYARNQKEIEQLRKMGLKFEISE